MSEGTSGTGRGKVIDLRGHREAEQALDALIAAGAGTGEYQALLSQAVRMGQPLLSALVRRIDASSPERLQTLGGIISFYPRRDDAVSALLYAASDRRNPDNRRLGATLLLEHVMGIPPADDFLSTLRDPAKVAADSLTGILDSSADDPALLNDYLRAVLTQPGDMAFSVLSALQELGGERTIEPLHVLSMHPEPEIMSSALGALEALAAQGSAAAVRALLTLEASLPPEAARSAERTLRKLRLSGFSIAPLSRPGDRCRALISPIDGAGDRLLWLVIPSVDGRRGVATIAGLLINEKEGLRNAVCDRYAGASDLPPARQVGTLHQLPRFPLLEPFEDGTFNNRLLTCLEIPFLYGLQQLREAARRNWASGTQLPLEYQLVSGALWEYSEGLSSDDPGEWQPQIPERQEPWEDESGLLDDPVFEDWSLESPGVSMTAGELAGRGDAGASARTLSGESWRLPLPALIRLAHEEFGQEMRGRYAGRLQLMSEWLAFAGEAQQAMRAASAARTIVQSPPEANRLVLRLVEKGLLAALAAGI